MLGTACAVGIVVIAYSYPQPILDQCPAQYQLHFLLEIVTSLRAIWHG